MSASWLRVLGLTIASVWLALGCGSSSKKTAVGGPCVLSRDCNKYLVCALGKCHQVCQESAQCLTGQSCVSTTTDDVGDAGRAGDAGSAGDAAEAGTRIIAICQLPAEAECTGTVCKGGLLCASDLRCRNGCASFTDCTYPQRCAGGFCADPSELDVNGQLPQKNPSLTADAGADVQAADVGGQDSGSDLAVGFPDAPSGPDVAEPAPDAAADLAADELPDADNDLVAEMDASGDLAVDTPAGTGP